MTKRRSRTGNIIAGLAAFLAVCGFNLLYQIRSESTMLSNSVFCMAAFAAFLYLGIRFFAGEVDRRLAVISLAGGLLFSAMTCFGFSLNYTDTIWQPNVFPAVLCLTPFFGICTGFGLRTLAQGGCAEKRALAGAEDSSRPAKLWKDFSARVSGLSGRKFYLLCFCVLFLSWVPVLLAAWPGIFSYDSGWQLAAFVDGDVTGHHPILHTALLGVTRMLGRALSGTGQAGNQTGALLYSLLQMLVMAALYARVCLYLRQRKAPGWLLVGSILFLGFHPANSLMALCATKDSIFTAVFAVFVVELLQIAEDREAFFASRKRQAVFCVTVFFLFAFRNNGFHTFLLCIPFLFFAFRRFWKKMLLLAVICLALYGIYNGPFYHMLGIEASDPREMCSVLMQSAARVYNLDNLGLTEEEKEAFLSIIDEEGMNSYLSRFADPVKAYFNGEKFAEDPWPFLKAWLSAGMRHKKIYIDSFLANTFGYWYPGNSIEDTDNGRDYFEYYCKDFREDVDVEMESKLPALSEFYRKIGNEASFQNVPVIAASFNLGVYTWLWLFACLLVLYRKSWKRALALVPFGAYFLTNLLGPVVKMRYHYPFIACAPLLFYLLWTMWKEAGSQRDGGSESMREDGTS